MAFRNSFLVFFFGAFAIVSNIIGGLAARQLLQITTQPNLPKLPPLPTIPNLPNPTTSLPPLPSMPTTLPQPSQLAKPTLPPLPSLPSIPTTLPKLSLPPLPATASLPNMPSIRTIPTIFRTTIPSIPFLSPPPSKTSP
ncbi:hypothetical protein FNV43_RR22257 [Rhamnella rubrinervis]|uniref:Uncharacterized protein n=1 Tax=Rhamnella rubrinervis TaxID=2594499 RepID=A0A8K0DQ55_9ROSA|nr:hypothetical protein FNV43_RR22257 [Rhamnella rubrinervis]